MSVQMKPLLLLIVVWIVGITASLPINAQPQDCINTNQINTGIFCITLYNPVCGCNNVTYDNECYAFFYGGVTSWTPGVCQPQGNHYYFDYTLCAGDSLPIGLSGWEGNVLYEWDTQTNLAGCAPACAANCANCYNITVAPAQTTTYTLHTFFTLAMEHNYYHYTINVFTCNSGDGWCIDPSVIDLTTACPDVYLPVCGCNFETYGNECEALNYYGVIQWAQGACQNRDTLYLCKNDSIQIGVPFVPETGYEWQPAQGLSCTDCPMTWVKPDTTTLYVLRQVVMIPGNYGMVSHYWVMVENCDTTGAGLPFLPTPSYLNLYPNPARQTVWLNFNNQLQPLQAIIFNLAGQAVYSHSFLPNEAPILPLNMLATGLYVVQLQTNNGILRSKLVINNP